LAIEVGRGLSGQDVAATLERLRFERGLPQRIYCDNGTEFVSAAMDLWRPRLSSGVARLAPCWTRIQPEEPILSRRSKPFAVRRVPQLYTQFVDGPIVPHALAEAAPALEHWRRHSQPRRQQSHILRARRRMTV